MRRVIVVGLSALLLTSCDAEPQEAAQPAQPRFEGLIVVGSPADAKASGFTDCVPEGNGYYGFTCVKPEATILGVKPLRAVVRLQYPSDLPHDAERLPERTVYSSIEYQFPEAEGYDSEGCDYVPANPYACITDQTQPLPSLTRVLREQGWLGRSTRWGAEYVKPDTQFKVSITTRKVHADIDGQRRLVVEVDVGQISDQEVIELVEMIQSDQRERTGRADANAAFAETMKAGG